MSDDEGDKFDLFASSTFISRLNAHTCPMCGNTSWAIETNPGVDFHSTTPQDPPTFTLKTRDVYMSPSSVVPTIAFTCHRCGFFRQHNLAWIKKMMTPNDDG